MTKKNWRTDIMTKKIGVPPFFCHNISFLTAAKCYFFCHDINFLSAASAVMDAHRITDAKITNLPKFYQLREDKVAQCSRNSSKQKKMVTNQYTLLCLAGIKNCKPICCTQSKIAGSKKHILPLIICLKNNHNK